MISKPLVPLLFFIIGLTSCREQYDPRIDSLEKSFLVVEGNLDPGADSTIIRLTRTYPLADTANVKMENSALVSVEGEDNTTRFLSNTGSGYYGTAGMNLTIGTQYRLRIKTIDGKEYLSGFVKARKTPLIDSISWERDPEGMWVYANTKDPSDATRYYRWDFDETWEIRSFYYSLYIYQRAVNSVRLRVLPAEDVSVCWKYDRSNSIILANSTRLQKDVIHKAPLTLLPAGSEKLSVRYSMFARQYALDKEAYNFFELMKKNTEEIGSIFTPQPSELKGNIECISDPADYVLGYVTISTVEKQRIFITSPPQWGFSVSCQNIEILDNPDSLRYYFGGNYYSPHSFRESPPPRVYFSAYPECVDCTTRGGSTVKPSYW